MDPEVEQEEIRKAQDAEVLLNNPILVSAFEQIEAAYTDQFRRSRIGESEKREHCFMMLQATRDLRGLLREIVTTGKLAEKAKVEREYQERLERGDERGHW